MSLRFPSPWAWYWKVERPEEDTFVCTLLMREICVPGTPDPQSADATHTNTPAPTPHTETQPGKTEVVDVTQGGNANNAKVSATIEGRRLQYSNSLGCDLQYSFSQGSHFLSPFFF